MSDSEVVISVENLCKQYRYGIISHRTLSKDLQSWWARVRGKEDPNLRVDQVNSLSVNRDPLIGKKTISPDNNSPDNLPREIHNSDSKADFIGANNSRNAPNNEEQITDNVSPDDRFWALKDVSFEVKQGEVLGIIGKNGAGKSTLLKIMSRVTTPTNGQIKIKGRVASLLEVGTGFHPELTGRENIFLNGAILGMSKDEIKKKFDEIVAFAEVEKFIDTPVKRYSSGMYVRLAFAVAAHLEPEILLVDEVLAVGDAAFQKKCLGKMQNIAGVGRTILFVSHNMTSISTLCHQVACLEEGEITFIGSVSDGIQKYLSNNNGFYSSHVNLEFRQERNGPSKFSRLVSLETSDDDNWPINQFKMGAPMRVKFDFRLKKYARNLEIGWAIFSSTGAKLQTFIGNWEGMKAEYSQGNHHVVCDILSVNLFPGIYTIGVWLKREGEAVDDQIANALEFEVIGSNMTGYNQYFERYPNCGVFQRSTWSAEGQ